MKIDRYFEADSRSSQWPRATGRTKNPLLNTYRSSQRTRMGRFGSALDIEQTPDRRQSHNTEMQFEGVFGVFVALLRRQRASIAP